MIRASILYNLIVYFAIKTEVVTALASAQINQ